MSDKPMKVYILKLLVPVEEAGRFYNEEDSTMNPAATRRSEDFAEWLTTVISNHGMMIRGYSQEVKVGIESHFMVCLFGASLEIEPTEILEVHLASGEIFESSEAIYYAKEEELTRLEGEVLNDWYSGKHGLNIPSLEKDTKRRLSRSCQIELRSRGFNGMTIRALSSKWIASILKKEPVEWEWSWFGT